MQAWCCWSNVNRSSKGLCSNYACFLQNCLSLPLQTLLSPLWEVRRLHTSCLQPKCASYLPGPACSCASNHREHNDNTLETCMSIWLKLFELRTGAYSEQCLLIHASHCYLHAEDVELHDNCHLLSLRQANYCRKWLTALFRSAEIQQYITSTPENQQPTNDDFELARDFSLLLT